MLAASRQLSSVLTMWSVGKQLRVLSIFHQCDRRLCVQTNTSQVEFVQKNSFGIRHCSHQTINTDSEDVRKIQRSSKRKPKSTSFQKKLHSRVFTEEEEVDEQQFKTQDFLSESDADMFGTLQKTEIRNVRDHSPVSSVVSSGQSDGLHSSDSFAKSADGKSANQENVAEHHALKKKSVRTWMQKVSQAKQSQSWSDEFGTLVEDSFGERIEESRSTAVGSHEERFSDDEDEQDSRRIRLSAVGRRRIPEWYGRRILKLGRKGQVREAVEVFEDWMLKQDRVNPNSFVFTCLLTVLGRAGYTKKAFSLFRKMKSMGIQPNAVAYTALFNACANSPWKTDGQVRAASLLRLMKKKEVEPTFITGKAMVKAFAMCGDLRRAFSLVDELSQVYRPDPEIFSFLLMACISDKEAGLCHAIKVWRVMRQMNVQPDRPLYNLLLRCVRDCGIGDRSAFITLLSFSDADSTQQSNLLHSDTKEDSGKVLSFSDVKQAAEISSTSVTSEQVLPEPETVTMDGEEHQPKDATEFRSQETGKPTEVISQCRVQNTRSSAALVLQSSATVPDVLSPNQQDSSIVSLGDLSTKESRLLLLGGVQGILSRMAKDGASPDVITFTQLISVAMPTVEAEQQLLEVMRTMRVKPDIDLVNTLIHKRCMRADFAAARSVGEIMLEHGLTSNQMTFGVLAMTCRTQEDAAQLLDDMEAADMAPNMEILGTLMYASGMKFAYKRWVLRQVQRLNLQPNVKFLNNVENSLATVRRRMVHAEKQGPANSYLLTPSFQRSVETFTQHYEAWLKQTQVQSSRHPWANFRSPAADGTDRASAEA